jgi:hypothetical protein
MEPVLALLVLAPVVAALIGRALFASGVSVDDLLLRPDLAWPKGVQEEEPVAWRLEHRAPAAHR